MIIGLIGLQLFFLVLLEWPLLIWQLDQADDSDESALVREVTFG